MQILVHGEQHNMMRLKSKLLSLNAQKTEKVKIFSPRNCEELLIPFKSDKMAKVVGKLASVQAPGKVLSSEDPDARLVTGVLVQNDFKLSLMAPEDLREYAGLNTTTVTCKQTFTLGYAGVDLIKWALEGTYGAIEELPEMHKGKASEGENVDGEDGGENGETPEEADEEVQQLVAAYLVMGCITVRYRSNREVEMEWEGNLHNDSIADSVMAVLMMVETSPAAVKRECPVSRNQGATLYHLHPRLTLANQAPARAHRTTTTTSTPSSPPKTPKQTPTPPRASAASSSSWKRSSAPTTSRPSRTPSCRPSNRRRRRRKPTPTPWTPTRRTRAAPRSWSACTRRGSPCPGWTSAAIRWRRGCGWRTWRWSASTRSLRTGLGLLLRGLARRLRRFGGRWLGKRW